jgi:hypothetical protein
MRGGVFCYSAESKAGRGFQRLIIYWAVVFDGWVACCWKLINLHFETIGILF